MNEQEAVRVVRGFKTQPRVNAWAQATIYGEWDVFVEFPGKSRRIFNTRESAQRFWRRLVAEGAIVR